MKETDRQLFAHSIGEAIMAYADVEKAQASLVSNLLEITQKRGHIVFFSIQNIRSRNEMIDMLLTDKYKTSYKKYWDSCSKFLLSLAKFRNAVAHWHPIGINYVTVKDGKWKASDKPSETGLINPTPGRGLNSLVSKDLEPFLKDCQYIRAELGWFTDHLDRVVRSEHGPWPQKFQQPITRQNQAVLQQRQTPKAQQPRRPPSVPKLSKAQKRAKARKVARLKAGIPS